MIKVPTYDSSKVGRAPAPAVQVFTGGGEDFAGRQTAELGHALQNFGGRVGAVAKQVQSGVDQLRVDEALDKVQNTVLDLSYGTDVGFANQKGSAALTRKSGRALSDEYTNTLGDFISKTGASLSSEGQREMFNLRANEALTSFRRQVMQHEANELHNYALSVFEGSQKTAVTEVALKWGDPANVDKAVERIKESVSRQGSLLGKPPEWQQARALELTSKAHKLALAQALDSGAIGYAAQYLEKYADQMEPEDLLAAGGAVSRETKVIKAVGLARSTFTSAQASGEVTEFDRAFSAIDARGRSEDYEVPDSVFKGFKKDGDVDVAKYKSDVDYKTEVDKNHFARLMRYSKGDLAKAYAAYYAGAEAVEEAAEEAKQKNNPDWLGFMPENVQDYVKLSVESFENGSRPKGVGSFQDLAGKLREDPFLEADPKAYKIAYDELKRLHHESVESTKQREAQAMADAMQELVQNGGRFLGLSPSVRNAIPYSKMNKVLSFAERLKSSADYTDLALYNEMLSTPGKLTGMSDAEFVTLRADLTEADFKFLARERGKLKGQSPGGGKAGDLDTGAIKTALDYRLKEIGIDTNSAKTDKENITRVGAIRRFVNTYFITAQAEAGKKFSDAEISGHLDALFAKNVVFSGFFSVGRKPLLKVGADEIPDSIRRGLTKAFEKEGNDQPTDAQLLHAYYIWASKNEKQ